MDFAKSFSFFFVCDAHLGMVAHCVECHTVLRHLEKELIGNGT